MCERDREEDKQVPLLLFLALTGDLLLGTGNLLIVVRGAACLLAWLCCEGKRAQHRLEDVVWRTGIVS